MKCNAMVTDDTFLLKIPDLFTAKSHGDATSALSRKKKLLLAAIFPCTYTLWLGLCAGKEVGYCSRNC